MNITDTGYLHEQDNQKIIRTSGKDQLLVEEKGLNTYKRIDEKECAAALVYWEKNKDYWGRVRKIWSDYLDTHASVSLKNKIDNKFLHEYLIAQAKEYAENKISQEEVGTRIKNEIARFINGDAKSRAGTN